jgi:hypothetical protein
MLRKRYREHQSITRRKAVLSSVLRSIINTRMRLPKTAAM